MDDLSDSSAAVDNFSSLTEAFVSLFTLYTSSISCTQRKESSTPRVVSKDSVPLHKVANGFKSRGLPTSPAVVKSLAPALWKFLSTIFHCVVERFSLSLASNLKSPD